MAQSPRPRVWQEGGCSDIDPTFRIRGEVAGLPTEAHFRPRWILPDGPRDNSQFLDFKNTPDQSHVYSFELIDTRDGSLAYSWDTTLLLRRPQPVDFTWTPNPICSPSTPVRFRVQTDPNWTYFWNVEGARQGAEFTHQFSGSGDFAVEVFTNRDANGCATPVNRKTVRVNPPAAPVIEVVSRLGCSSVMDGRAEYIFVARSIYAGADRSDWAWDFDPAYAPALEMTAETLRIRLPSGAHEIGYRMTASNSCEGETRQSFDLVTREHPRPVLLHEPDRTVFCAGESVQLRNATVYPDSSLRVETVLFVNDRLIDLPRPFESHELTYDNSFTGVANLRHYDRFRLDGKQCIWVSEPFEFVFHGPPPNFFAHDSSRGICRVPDTSLITIQNMKPGVRYTWTLYDFDGNIVDGFPREVIDEAELEFIVRQMPQLYSVQLEEETPHGCKLKTIKPAFITAVGDITASFYHEDKNEFCRLTPKESVWLFSSSEPQGYGLEHTWYRYAGVTDEYPDGYHPIGEGDSLFWGGVTTGVESIKLKVNNYNQCADSTTKERLIRFIGPDWRLRIEPTVACAPVTYRVTAYDAGSFPPEYTVNTNFALLSGENFRRIDERTLEVLINENRKSSSIQFSFGFNEVQCSDALTFDLHTGVGTRLIDQKLTCIGTEGYVSTNPKIANEPTSFEWQIEGDADLEILEEAVDRIRFIPKDAMPFRIRQIVHLETETTGICSDTSAWASLQANPFNVNLIAEPDSIECTPASIDFNLQAEGVASVVWNWGDGTLPETTDTLRAGHIYVNGGTFTVSVEAVSKDGCRNRDTTTVLVIVPEPDFRFTPDTKTLCNGEQLIITNETNDEIKELTIDWGDNSSVLSQNSFPQGDSLTHTYQWEGSSPRPITLRYVVDLGKCRPVVGLREIEVEPKFDVALTSFPQLCVGSSYEAEASTQASGIIGYRWSVSPAAEAENAVEWAASVTTEPRNRLIAHKAGDWLVTVTALRQTTGEERRVCEASATQLIPAFGTETELFVRGARRVCAGREVLMESSNVNGVEYIWQIGDAPPVSTGTRPSYRQYFERPGSFDVRLWVIDALGCTLSVHKPLFIQVVSPGWETPPVLERELLCEKDTLRVDSRLPEGTPLHWRILNAADGRLLEEIRNLAIPDYDLVWPLPDGLRDAGLHISVEAEVMPGCSTGLFRLAVQIPPLSRFDVKEKYSRGLCPPTEATLDLRATNARYVEWDSDDDGATDGAGTQFRWNIEAGSAAGRLLRIRAENPAGCPNDTLLLYEFKTPPDLKMELTASACRDQNVTLNALAADGRKLAQVRWNFGDGQAAEGDSAMHLWKERGKYSIRVDALDEWGCPAEAETEIEVSAPVADFQANHPEAPDTLYFPPAIRIQVENRSQRASSFVWRWRHLQEESPEPSLELPKIEGEYGLKLTAIDSAGCLDEKEMLFYVAPVDLQLPTVFTPNGDGVNDSWTVFYSGDDRVNVWIYDRTGVEVFRGTGEDIRWDGRYQGKPVPAGVYYWRLRAGPIDRTGSLTLIR